MTIPRPFILCQLLRFAMPDVTFLIPHCLLCRASSFLVLPKLSQSQEWTLDIFCCQCRSCFWNLVQAICGASCPCEHFPDIPKETWLLLAQAS